MTSLFLAIVNMSISASIVAVVIIILRFPMRKAPKIFSYAIWGILLYRLVSPFTFESALSLLPIKADVIPKESVYQFPTDYGYGATRFPGVEYEMDYVGTGVVNDTSFSTFGFLMLILSIVWICGLVVIVAYSIASYIKFKNLVLDATLVEDNVYETDKIKTAFVLGLFSPKIYIPCCISGEQRSYILEHERVHIKRKDYIIKPIAFLVLAVHWFNPLVWLSYFLMTSDMEMSCDEAVLRNKSNEERSKYSTLLLSLSTARSGILNPLAFGENNVKSRVGNVLNFKKPKTWVIIIAVAIVVVVCIGFLTNRATVTKEPPTATIEYSQATGGSSISNLEYLSVKPSGFEWSHKASFGRWINTIADAEHPLFVQDLPQAVNVNGVVIRFDTIPEIVVAKYWMVDIDARDDGYHGNVDDYYFIENAFAGENCWRLEFPPELEGLELIVEVTVTWEDNGEVSSYGDSSYVFAVVPVAVYTPYSEPIVEHLERYKNFPDAFVYEKYFDPRYGPITEYVNTEDHYAYGFSDDGTITGDMQRAYNDIMQFAGFAITGRDATISSTIEFVGGKGGNTLMTITNISGGSMAQFKEANKGHIEYIDEVGDDVDVIVDITKIN